MQEGMAKAAGAKWDVVEKGGNGGRNECVNAKTPKKYWPTDEHRYTQIHTDKKNVISSTFIIELKCGARFRELSLSVSICVYLWANRLALQGRMVQLLDLLPTRGVRQLLAPSAADELSLSNGESRRSFR
jgi:hypothetical protein